MNQTNSTSGLRFIPSHWNFALNTISVTNRVLTMGFLIFIPGLAFSWSVDSVIGKVEAQIDHKWKQVESSQVLKDGTKLRTLKASKIRLLEDGSQLYLAENSEITIAPSAKDSIQLLRGKLRANLVNLKPKPNPEDYPFTVKTKTAVAGVRGTEFFVALGEDEKFCTFSGMVEVRVGKEAGYTIVPPGKGLIIGKGKNARKLVDNNPEQSLLFDLGIWY
jgi:FecR protein